MPILYVTTSPHFEYDDSRYTVVPCSTIEYVGFEAQKAMDARDKAVFLLKDRWSMEDLDSDCLPEDVCSINDVASYGYRVWKYDVQTTDVEDMRMILVPSGEGLPGWRIGAVARVEDLASTMEKIASALNIEDENTHFFVESVSVRLLRPAAVFW